MHTKLHLQVQKEKYCKRPRHTWKNILLAGYLAMVFVYIKYMVSVADY